MNTGAARLSSGNPIVAAVPQTIEAIRQAAIPSRQRECLDDEWGRSESLDPDDVGDIADEGAGHRG